MEENLASRQIDIIIAAQSDWKKEMLTKLRTIIRQADPNIVEDVKWKTPSRPAGLPVWVQGGIVCMAEIWKDNIKLLFPKGVSLNDSHKLFNSRLDSSKDRAIEFREGDIIYEAKLKQLVIEAAKLNIHKLSKKHFS